MTRAELKEELQLLEQHVDVKLQSLSETLVTRMRELQRESTAGFGTFARTAHVRMRGLEASDHATITRLAMIEDRLLEIEQRLGMQPLP